jgi:hypothetical protein
MLTKPNQLLVRRFRVPVQVSALAEGRAILGVRRQAQPCIDITCRHLCYFSGMAKKYGVDSVTEDTQLDEVLRDGKGVRVAGKTTPNASMKY